MARTWSTEWRRRPALAMALRVFVFVAPVAASVATSVYIAHVLPRPSTVPHYITSLAIMFALSTVVLYATSNLFRRLLPLAAMLQLALAFPGKAPSRMRLARRAASTRALAEQVQRAREQGIDDEPTRAAEQIVLLAAAEHEHDRATRGHSERVREITDRMGAHLHLSAEARDRLRWAALLHDIGKLIVPPEVLNKPSFLIEEEWKIVRAHPEAGVRFAAPLAAWLGEWMAAIEHHHEHFDGTGYPKGLAGHEISYAGRIVAVADAYDTMTAARPYRRALTAEAARKELVSCSGAQFDPQVVRAFLESHTERHGVVASALSWLAQTPALRAVIQAATAARVFGVTAALGGAMILAVTPAAILPGTAGPQQVSHVLGVHITRTLPTEASAPVSTGHTCTADCTRPVPKPNVTPGPREIITNVVGTTVKKVPVKVPSVKPPVHVPKLVCVTKKIITPVIPPLGLPTPPPVMKLVKECHLV